jgi:hypothetical protein
MIAIPSNTALLAKNEAFFPQGITNGYLLLLTGDLQPANTVTADIVLDRIAAAVPHGLVDGSRVRFTTDGTLPSPLLTGIDYYAVVVSASATEIQVSATLGGYPIDLASVGIGSHTMLEQEIKADDPLNVIINKELSSGGAYSRLPVSFLPAAAIVANEAIKSKVVSLENTGLTSIAHRSTMLIYGGTATIGDTTGITGYELATELADQYTAAGQTRDFALELTVRAA